MPGIIRARERDQGAVQGLDFRRDHRLDVVAVGEEAQATGAAVRPRRVEIEQGGGDLGTAVGMQGAMAAVHRIAQGDDARLRAQSFDAQVVSERIGVFRGAQFLDQPAQRRAAIRGFVGKEAGAAVAREIRDQALAVRIVQLPWCDQEMKRLAGDKAVATVEAVGIEQALAGHDHCSLAMVRNHSARGHWRHGLAGTASKA